MHKPAVTSVVTLAALALGGLVLGAGGLAAADPPSTETRYVPHAKTIVEVRGDKRHGFVLHRYDGSRDALPPSGEARTACRTHDSRVGRVRCRTEVRVRYSALGDLKRSINYQQSLIED